MTPAEIKQQIIIKAQELGFDRCGFAAAHPVPESVVGEKEQWLAAGKAAGLDYLHRNKDLRYNPCLLQPGARSLIVVAMNYYPQQEQQGDARFAYYAYGADYHFVIKQRLQQLLDFIVSSLDPAAEGKVCSDSAPVMERYWAQQAGIGFQGRNGLIIVPGLGSYVLLGEIITNLNLPPNAPLKISCQKCHRCEQECPTQALCNGLVDARQCISYQTIENHTDQIPPSVRQKMGNRIYGCDACQQACPWNQRFARPTQIPEFAPSDEFLSLSRTSLSQLTTGSFKRLFKNSAVQRAGLKGLRRNLGDSLSE